MRFSHSYVRNGPMYICIPVQCEACIDPAHNMRFYFAFIERLEKHMKQMNDKIYNVSLVDAYGLISQTDTLNLHF